MKEVIKNIQELYTLLESTIDSYEKKSLRLDVSKKEVEDKDNMLAAKSKNLSAMERIYKKYEDFDKEKSSFEEVKKDVEKRVKLAEVREKNDSETLKQIEKERAELDIKKIALNKQGSLIKEKELNFDKKKADLQSLISGNAIKDMLK